VSVCCWLRLEIRFGPRVQPRASWTEPRGQGTLTDPRRLCSMQKTPTGFRALTVAENCRTVCKTAGRQHNPHTCRDGPLMMDGAGPHLTKRSHRRNIEPPSAFKRLLCDCRSAVQSVQSVQAGRPRSRSRSRSLVPLLVLASTTNHQPSTIDHRPSTINLTNADPSCTNTSRVAPEPSPPRLALQSQKPQTLTLPSPVLNNNIALPKNG
jgi:hypothetical protein